MATAPTLGFLSLVPVFLATTSSSVRAQGVNVNVGPLGDTHKKRWYVWLIISVAGAAFLISLFWTIRGMVVWRKRVRALRAQRKAVALGVSPDKLPPDDVELGLFSFWDVDDVDKQAPTGAAKGTAGRSRSRPRGVLMTDADTRKLRDMHRGTVAQQEAERLYRTGQHPNSAELLYHLRRTNSF